jgi:hypothetical protein
LIYKRIIALPLLEQERAGVGCEAGFGELAKVRNLIAQYFSWPIDRATKKIDLIKINKENA